MGTEATIEARAIDKALARGAWETKLHQDGIGRRGRPDRLLCYRGLFLALEFKAPGARTDPGREAHQLHELCSIREAGGLAFYVEDADVIDVILDRIDEALNEVDLAEMERQLGSTFGVFDQLRAWQDLNQPLERKVVQL